ncbi:LacI family DNA-binding transcriptional regulator [Nocardioides sp. GY 10127]|uniref:LacI family DNA-binding transcriptional regulator n=1 Tax=Nocardioides sp. GY 10127 TaxID=2569762 RepID=UPI001F0F1FA7|nr:LacI family DNA-binding transcriptional regulator [Nocardioides sp. GY 10127]
MTETQATDPSAPRRRSPTAADVAERAGVSISTVSKALSGKGAVRHETRERIVEAARELRYQTNAVAASLLAGRTNTVGVITSDRFGRLTAPVLLGATEALAQEGVALLLCDGRGDRIREQFFVDSFLQRRVDGILVTGAGIFGRESVGRDLSSPTVYAMAWSDDPHDVSVVPDDAAGTEAAVRHLLATGRRRLAFVSGRWDDASRVRLNRTTDVLEGQGHSLVHPPLLGQWTEGWGRQAAQQLIRSGIEFDGVVCGNDQIARGVAESLRDAGIDVPHQVGVVGFDNWDVMVDACRPPLTSVDLGLYDVGQIAARLLLDAMGGQQLEGGVRRTPCHLVPRESTATP